MAEFTIASWLLWTLGIAFIASLLSNGGGLLPPINTLHFSNTEGKLIMLLTTLLAFWLWIAINPETSAAQAGITITIIALFALAPNALIHRYYRDNGHAKGSWGRTEEGWRPNSLTRLNDLILDIKAELCNAQDALRAQSEMLQNLHTIFDPGGTRKDDEQ